MKELYNNSIHYTLEETFSSMDEALNYRFKELAQAYPKFYKMDLLSKLGVGSIDAILKEFNIDCPKEKTGIVLSTSKGCHLSDAAFSETITQEFFPSPSLFVYTLPNIVVGEICIRNKWQGENMVFIQENMNNTSTNDYAKYMIDTLGMEVVWNITIDIQKEKSHTHIIVLKK